MDCLYIICDYIFCFCDWSNDNCLASYKSSNITSETEKMSDIFILYYIHSGGILFTVNIPKMSSEMLIYEEVVCVNFSVS